jgi:hypothetical protein
LYDNVLYDRRRWFRLLEKGGKHHEVPVHHKAQNYVAEYLEKSDFQPNAPLFQTYHKKKRGCAGTKNAEQRDVNPKRLSLSVRHGRGAKIIWCPKNVKVQVIATQDTRVQDIGFSAEAQSDIGRGKSARARNGFSPVGGS